MADEQKNITPPGEDNEKPLETESAYQYNKILDFILGFAGAILIGWVTMLTGSWLNSVLTPVLIFLSAILFLFFCYFFWVHKRKFIVYGMLAIFLVPIFAFGACMLVFSGGW